MQNRSPGELPGEAASPRDKALAHARKLLLILPVALILAGCGLTATPPSGGLTATPTSGAPLVAGVAASPNRAPAAAEPATWTAAPPLPVRLVIPAINVDAAVQPVGNTSDGAMDVPKRWGDVGWYGLGFRPGEDGSAVMAGHLDSTTGRAVFWNLNRLKVGDSVDVRNSDGSRLSFAVASKELYAFDNAPLRKIFGPADVPELNLITCSGAFDRASRNYDKRLVVYTQQVAAEP
ncbi:MAG: class F sortase [Chloroflexota bacterium]